MDFSGRKLGQYAGQELLKSLFQNKPFSKCMTSTVSSKNKEKKAKRKNSGKINRPNRKKNGTKIQKIASPGVEPGLHVQATPCL